MNKKLVPFYELGFRITLINPPMLKLPDGSLVPSPNLKKLQDLAFRALAEKQSRLLGQEIRFIRKYLRMTQVLFADWLNMSNHSIISQWEHREDRLSGMDYNTEILLRLQMIGIISKKGLIPIKTIDKMRDLKEKEESVKIEVS